MDVKREAAIPAPKRTGFLERAFRLAEHGTCVRTELLAGLTTFLTMAYIVFVNPGILADAGMPRDAVFVATCLAAAFGSAVMAFHANVPIALAPGMDLNAYFAYGIVQGMGYTWQAALGAVFISGLCFLAVTLTGLRRIVLAGIPPALRIALTAGIGLFLAIIALKNAGLIAASPATFVTLGDLHRPGTVLAAAGFLMVAALSARKVPAALLASILAVTALSFAFAGNAFRGVASLPPAIGPTLLALDLRGALSGGLLNVVLVLFLVELFDATGTLMAVASRAGLLTGAPGERPERPAPRWTGEGAEPHPAAARSGTALDRALIADSAAIVAGALLGTSSTTAYLESASGVAEGGRTGLAAATVAALFLACLFFAPLAAAVPPYATAPALFYVACLMLRDLAALDWDDLTEAIPACVTALLMPFTYSIATGIAFGFITYAALKLLTGRARAVKPVVWVIAALFLARFAAMGGGS